MDVVAGSCDVDGPLTADVENDEGLDLKTALSQGQLVVMLIPGCEDQWGSDLTYWNENM